MCVCVCVGRPLRTKKIFVAPIATFPVDRNIINCALWYRPCRKASEISTLSIVHRGWPTNLSFSRHNHLASRDCLFSQALFFSPRPKTPTLSRTVSRSQSPGSSRFPPSQLSYFASSPRRSLLPDSLRHSSFLLLHHWELIQSSLSLIHHKSFLCRRRTRSGQNGAPGRWSLFPSQSTLTRFFASSSPHQSGRANGFFSCSSCLLLTA